jgi:curved DNA-binding protein CbpA
MAKIDATKDCYKELGLDKTATDSDIRKAFRQRALQYHPDRNPGREQEVVTKFQDVQAAYEILIDATQRAKYDNERRKFRAVPPVPQFTPFTPRGTRPAPPQRSAYTTTPNGGTFYSRPAPPQPQPPPQRPPPRHSSTFGNGANRFTHENFRTPPTAQQPDNKPKNDFPRAANDFTAWTKMKQARAAEPRTYNPNNPNGTPFGRSKSTRTPSDKKGFDPGTPGADEGQAKSSYRSNYERPNPSPAADENAPQAFMAKDVPFTEALRFRTPYSSAKAGERTSMYGDGVGRSANVQNSPAQAQRPASSADAGAKSDSGRHAYRNSTGPTPRTHLPHMYDSSDEEEEAEVFTRNRVRTPIPELPKKQPVGNQNPFGTPQMKPGPTNGASPNPFKSRSEEGINMKFSPSDWHGKFEGEPDYFAPNMQKGAANKGRTSPTRRRPQHFDTEWDPARGEMPPPPPGPPPNVQTTFPNVPESANHSAKFAPEAWAETFKEAHWAYPQKTGETSPRRGTATAKRSNPVRKPSGTLDSTTGAARQKAKPKYQAFAEDAENVDAMDIDSESPPTPETKTVPPTSGVPNLSQSTKLSGSGTVPNENDAATPAATAAKPTSPGLDGLDGLANVAPFLPTNDGLAGLDDLKNQLPFASEASNAHPTKPTAAQKLKFPTVPRVPPVPISLDPTSIELYFTQMEGYIRQYRQWSAEITNHLAARDVELEDLDDQFIRQRGERTNKFGFASYLQKMKEDEGVLETRRYAQELHIKALEQCEGIRNKAAKQQKYTSS